MATTVAGSSLPLAVAIVAATGCTDLRVVNRVENTTLPWYEESPRWESTSYSATAQLDEGLFSITSSIPHLPSACVAASLGESVCEDRDEDGLVDEWENIVSHRLNPVIRYHRDEPLFTDQYGRVHAFSRVTPVDNDELRIRVIIVLAYSYDYGRCSIRTTSRRRRTRRV